MPFREIVSKQEGEGSASIRSRVEAARRRQIERFQGRGIYANAQMGPCEVKAFCPIGPDGEKLLEAEMKISKLKIGSITADIPIVQGGMGVRVSLSSLAAAVAREGAVGTISSIGLGDPEASKNEYEKASREALESEIRKAKSSTDGNLAVNFMGVLSNVDDLILTAVREGIKMIVYGAGLPAKLPGLVEDPSVNLVPIVSSGRVAELILRSWEKRFARTADALILEGPLAGGHLGFSLEQHYQESRRNARAGYPGQVPEKARGRGQAPDQV